MTDMNPDDDFSFSLSKKKKKKKKIGEADIPTTTSNACDTDQKTDYSYMFLLERIQDKMPKKHAINRVKLMPPILTLLAKKTIWVNFDIFARQINRPAEHISLYFTTELTTHGTFNSARQLILSGRFRNQHIEQLIKNYVKEYVECSVCNRLDTFLRKDNVTRLQFLVCNVCSSERTTAPIRAGFKATTRTDRKDLKNKEK